MATKKTKKTPAKSKPAKPKSKPATSKPAKPAVTVDLSEDDLIELIEKAIAKIDRGGIEAAVAAGAKLDPALHSVVYAESKLSPKDVSRAKLLLELGADPNYVDEDDTSVLYQLSFAPNQDAALEILEAMLAKHRTLRVTPSQPGNTPLHVAMWYGKHVPYWEKLVAIGNPIASGADSPIFDAISHGNNKGVDWLLGKGATLDGTLAFARDPANYCGDKTVKYLEKLGAKT